MDAQTMQEMLDALTGKRTAQIDPATLSDAELISEFEEVFAKRSGDEGSANERKSQTLRLRALASEKAKREAAKPRGRKSATKADSDSDS